MINMVNMMMCTGFISTLLPRKGCRNALTCDCYTQLWLFIEIEPVTYRDGYYYNLMILLLFLIIQFFVLFFKRKNPQNKSRKKLPLLYCTLLYKCTFICLVSYVLYVL